MAEIATAYVSLLPSLKGGKSAIAKELGGPLDAAGKEGGARFGGGMKSGIAGMASKVFAPLAAAAGAVALGGWVKGAIAEAGNLEQSVGAVDTVFKESAGQIHDWAAGAATSVGLTANQYNEFGTLIATQLKNGGTAMDELGPKTNEMITLGADLASMFGGTTADAVGALSSALKGERDPIERYGVSLTQAKIDAEAAALGFEKVGSTLSAEAQQAATLSLIMQQTADAHGNFGRETQTLAGQQAILSAQWTNFSSMIGALFVPALTSIMGVVTGSVMPALTTMSTGLQGLYDLIVGGDFTGALSSAFGWEEDGAIVDALFNIREAFTGAGGGFDGLLAAAQVAFDGLVGWLTGGGIESIFAALLAGRERLFQAAMELFPALIEGATAVLPALVAGVAAMIPQVADFLLSSVPLLLTAAVQLFTALIEAVGVVVPQLAGTITTLLPQLVGVLLGMLPTVLATAVTLFSALLDAVVTVLPGLLSTLLGMLPGVISAVLSMVPQLLTAALTLFLALLNAVLEVLPQLLTLLLTVVIPQVLTTILGMLPQLLETAISVFMALLQAVMEILPQLLTLLIGTVIPQVLSTVLGMLPQLLSTAVTVFMAILTGLVQVLPQIIGFIFGTLIPTVVTEVGKLAGKLLTAGVEALGGLLEGIGKKWPDIMAWFVLLPSRVSEAIGDAGRWLYDSGKAIIQGLIDGITDVAGKVKDAVGDVLATARDLLPFSPAKEGPFSGKGWTLYSGRSISSALAEGIADNGAEVEAAARSVMDAASVNLAPRSVVSDLSNVSSGSVSAAGISADQLRDALAGVEFRIPVSVGGREFATAVGQAQVYSKRRGV